MLEVTNCDYLKQTNHCPTRPHDPAVNSTDVAHATTSAFWAPATATVRIQLDCKVAIVLPVILKLWATCVKSVNHIDILPQWYCIMVWSSFCQFPLSYELRANSVSGPVCGVCISDSCGRVVTCTVDVNLNATRAVCFPYYHISLWHRSSITKREVAILWDCADVLNRLSRSIVGNMWWSTIS